MNSKSPSGRRTSSRTRGSFLQLMAAAVAIVLGVGLTSMISMSRASAMPPNCSAPAGGTPMLVTADCIDPKFNRGIIDVDEWRDMPVRHRYVNGHFDGTDTRFSFYFPPPEQYQGRFFQNTHQLLTSENTPPDNIGFAVASGAYFVQTNLGGSEAIRSVEDALILKKDPSVVGYRVNAAAAKFSREMAAKMYGGRRTFGYLYGGSGGAYQTISALENTAGVWDGGIPHVMGSPNSIPSMFTVRIHALRVLRMRDKLPAILDAIDPGGSGNPYAGLNEEERGALEEATVPAELAKPESTVTVKATHSFSKPGSYFPVLRASSQREGDTKTPYTRVQNLARVRVVVR
jgi:hypothetical protein